MQFGISATHFPYDAIHIHTVDKTGKVFIDCCINEQHAGI
jgi:hypothetical protein